MFLVKKKNKMSKIRRKVTVENTKTISDSTSRRPSVFERLGPSTGSSSAEVRAEILSKQKHFIFISAKRDLIPYFPYLQTQCRNWMKTGNCSYGNTCRFIHSPRGKGFSGSYRR